MDNISFDLSNLGKEVPLTTTSPQQQNDNSFYTAMIRGTDPVEDFKKINADYLVNGDSTLVNQTKDILQRDQDQKRAQTVRDILEDPSVSIEEKRNVVGYYVTTKQLPVSLQDKYAEKVALANPQNTKLSDDSFVTQFHDKTEYLKNSRPAQDGVISALLSGVAYKGYSAAKTFGLVSERDYQALQQSYQPVQQEYPIATGIGGMVPMVGSTLISGPAGTIIASIVEGTAKYAELGETNVDQKTRLVSSLADAGMTATMLSTPIGKAATLLKQMALNGAVFVTMGELNRVAQNIILDAYPDLQQKQDWKSITVSAIMGMAAGALSKITQDIPRTPDTSYKGNARPYTEPKKPNGSGGTTYEGTATEVKGTPPLLTGDTTSPFGTTALHDQAKAADIGAAAVMDDTGQISKAVGEERANIVAEQFFSKVNQEELKDVPSGIVDRIDQLTDAGISGYVRTETNPFIYGQAGRDAIKDGIVKTIQDFKQAAYHQSKSSITETENGYVKGVATYGPTMDTSYTTFQEAQQAWNNLREQVTHGDVIISKLDPKTNTIKPLSKYDSGEGSYYVQWKFQQAGDALGGVLFGEDAVSVSLNIPFLNKPIKGVDKALTTLARTPYLNRIFLPGTHFLGDSVAKGAMVAEDMMMGIEQPLVRSLQDAIGSLSRSKGELDLFDYIRQTGSEETRVWSYGEISTLGRARGFNETQIEKVANTYYLSRRVYDITWLHLNRKEYRNLTNREMIQYDFSGKPVYAKPLKTAPNTTKIWDEKLQTVRDIDKKEIDLLYSQGGHLAEMAYPTHVGNDHVDYMVIPSGTKKGPLGDYVLNRIKGYSPQGYDEYFFVQAEPREATRNGYKLPNPDDIKDPLQRDVARNAFAKLRTVHAATETRSDAEKLVEEFSKNFPEKKWSWRTDRVDANSLLQDAKIYAENMARSNKRGDRLITVDGKAKLIDPLVMQYRSIAAISRMSAFDEWITHFQKSFMKSYRRFLNDPSTFPVTMNDFKKPKHATEGGSSNEMQAYRDAQVQFLYYRSLFENRSLDQDLWKRGFYYLGNQIDKLSEDIGRGLKTVGRSGYPPDIVKKVCTALFIHLGGVHTAAIQASQVFQYMMAQPKWAMNPNYFFRETLSLAWGTMFVPHKGATSRLINSKVGQSVVNYIGAKVIGIGTKDYYELIQAWKDSGLPYAVDNNLMLNGVFGKGKRGLKESPLEYTTQTISGIANSIPNLGKTAFFDPWEGFNMIAAWSVSRYRFIQDHPNVKWNAKESLSQIQSDARAISGELNRAGSLGWSKGVLSLPLQFQQTPYKILLNTLTGKTFTPEEKSRMFVGNLILFGGSAYYLQDRINWLREKFGDILSPEMWIALAGGIMNLQAHFLFNLGLTEKEKVDSSDLALSQGFSPFGNKFAAMQTLGDMSDKSFAEVMSGPSWSVFNSKNGRIPMALRDISQVFSTKDMSTKETIKRVMIDAAEVTSSGTAWMKMQYALETGKIIASAGNDTGLHADRKAAIAKIFGVSTLEELDLRYLNSKKFDEDKEIKEEAKYIVQQATKNVRFNYADKLQGADVFDKEAEFVKSYMSVVANNPDHERKLLAAIKGIKKDMFRTEGDNMDTLMYMEALKLSDKERVEMSQFLRSSGNPKHQELADQINSGINVEKGKGY